MVISNGNNIVDSPKGQSIESEYWINARKIISEWAKESGEPYSPVRHLASAIFPFSDKDKYMLMLNAYFDETGRGDDPRTKFVGLAGCFERAETWIDFEPEWINILTNAGVKSENEGERPYFHMSDFAHSEGIFKDWKGDEPRRRKLIDKLWGLILETKPYVVGAFLKLEDYRQVLSKENQEGLVDPYYPCYMQSLAFVFSLLKDRKNYSVATIFDYKKGFVGNAYRIYDVAIAKHPEYEQIISIPNFAKMKHTVPIQVADMIVYESYKEFDRREYGSEYKPRPELKYLETLISIYTGDKPFVFGVNPAPIIFFSRDDLREFDKHMRENV